MTTPPQTPGPDKTGPPPVKPARNEIPVQEMEKFERDQQALKNMTDASGSNGIGTSAGTGGAGNVDSYGVGISPGTPAMTPQVPLVIGIPQPAPNANAPRSGQ